jgi:hypothetical protein
VHASEEKKHLPFVSVIITTFFLYTNLKFFSKVMIEGQEVTEGSIRLLSVEGQPTRQF